MQLQRKKTTHISYLSLVQPSRFLSRFFFLFFLSRSCTLIHIHKHLIKKQTMNSLFLSQIQTTLNTYIKIKSMSEIERKKINRGSTPSGLVVHDWEVGEGSVCCSRRWCGCSAEHFAVVRMSLMMVVEEGHPLVEGDFFGVRFHDEVVNGVSWFTRWLHYGDRGMFMWVLNGYNGTLCLSCCYCFVEGGEGEFTWRLWGTLVWVCDGGREQWMCVFVRKRERGKLDWRWFVLMLFWGESGRVMVVFVFHFYCLDLYCIVAKNFMAVMVCYRGWVKVVVSGGLRCVVVFMKGG